MDAAIEWAPSVANVLSIQDLQINCNTKAADGILLSQGISHGSDISRVKIVNPTRAGVYVSSYLYSCLFQQVISSGGQYGICIIGNSPTNGATLSTCRVSNTSVEAIHIENTGNSTGQIVLLNNIIEGNKAVGLFVQNCRASLFGGWFENNGSVSGGPDVSLSSASSIITQAKLYDVVFSTANEDQLDGVTGKEVRCRFGSTHCQLYLHGGYQNSLWAIDGGGFNTGCRVVIADDATAVNVQNGGGTVVNRN